MVLTRYGLGRLVSGLDLRNPEQEAFRIDTRTVGPGASRVGSDLYQIGTGPLYATGCGS